MLILIESDVSVVIAARLIVLRPTLSPFTHTGRHRVSDTFQIAIHFYNGASEMKIIFFFKYSQFCHLFNITFEVINCILKMASG